MSQSQYKEKEIREYLKREPSEFSGGNGGIVFGLFELMEFMNKHYQRLSDRLKSQAQLHRGIGHFGHRSHVSQQGAHLK